MSGERDDDPTPRLTVPATLTPGQRFMERVTPWSWDVYDWQTKGCVCIGTGPAGEHGEPTPKPDCTLCRGTGDDGQPEPYLVASGLDEHDARLLVFGPDLLAACKLWDEGFTDGEQFTPEQLLKWVNANRRAAREAIAKAVPRG